MSPFRKSQTSQVRLQELKRSPNVEDLVGAMRVAQQRHKAVICLPWTDENGTFSYNITVTFPENGGEPKWVLHSGFGSRVIAAHASGDVSLIHNLIVTHCGGTHDDAPDDLRVKTGNNIPRIAIPTSSSSAPPPDPNPSGWAKIRNKAISETAQRLGIPENIYDPHEAERQRILERQKTDDREKDKQNTQSSNILVGDLLVGAGLISREDLLRFMPVCKQTGLPIGRILVESSLITEPLVRAAVTAQSLIRDKQLHFQLAVSAIKLAAEKSITFESALTERGWHADYYEITNKLGQLLLDAGCISHDQLHEATEVSFASGLPLGRVLVLRKMVPELVAYIALTVQILLREEKINREEALKSIHSATSMGTTVHEWLQQDGHVRLAGVNGNAIRLGELLILAGIISEIDLLSAVESSLTQKEMIGQILVRTDVLTEPVLEQALKLQKAVNSQLMSATEAARMIREIYQSHKEDRSTTENIQSVVDADLAKIIKAFGASNSEDLKGVLQTLLQQKENLAFRLVSEQEELKHRLARELNDTIIAELQMLKTYLAGDEKMSTVQSIEIVDNLVLQMSEICNDFVPKQLHERGLELAVQDLVERVSKRSGMYCDSTCNGTVMKLPQPVQLHMFRIIQEWINIIEKYARASKVSVRFDQLDPGRLKVVVTDNGKGTTKGGAIGIDPRTTGIKGLQNLQERIELIRCYFDTRIEMEAQPGASRIELEISGKTL